ncbi:MAG: flagellar biosynthetic protein FliO [Kofleriaceae bacterium]|nr:flagellar biosynthetic protein FliO [Kofleriaceae bacterium]MBP9169051.1 flagellar biosynthetic protein FliO [Kofleriaceae bacterium]MBP9858772.1 flagellar biosynthetic protein FliO [Kofleriaceae bacterium]
MRAPEVAAQASAGDGYAGLLVTTVVLLAVVCLVAFVVVRLLRRGLEGRPVGERLVSVVARVPLEPRRSLYVVRVGGKTLLLGASEGGLSLLSELDGAALPSTTEVSAGQRFADLVSAAWGRRRGGATSAGPPAGGDEGPT